MPQAKENKDVLAQIVSNTEVTLNGVTLPEFVLEIYNKKSVVSKGTERMLLEFTKVWKWKDNFNPDEARKDDDILIATSYLFEVLDPDRLDVFLARVDEETPANSLSGRLYFEDAQTWEPTKNCAAWNGILNFVSKTSRNFRGA